MNDLIERQSVIDAFWKLDVEIRPSVINSIIKMINDIPFVTPQQNVGVGRWIKRGQDICCSMCNNESAYNPFGANKFSKYCPNCGAKMEEG